MLHGGSTSKCGSHVQMLYVFEWGLSFSLMSGKQHGKQLRFQLKMAVYNDYHPTCDFCYGGMQTVYQTSCAQTSILCGMRYSIGRSSGAKSGRCTA